MGVQYYDGETVKSAIGGMLSPIGFFQFLVVPFASDTSIQFLRILAFETPETTYYKVPFEGFWGLIHLLFWCGWINHQCRDIQCNSDGAAGWRLYLQRRR